MLLAIIAVAGCTDGAPSVAGPRGSSATPGGAEAGVIVEVRLPERHHCILGPATGRVFGSDGELVATFEFESAWLLPGGIPNSQSPATSTGADPSVIVRLPEPGTYRFELDSIAVSNTPCGTCEEVLDGVSMEAYAEDGSTVELPAGETLAVS